MIDLLIAIINVVQVKNWQEIKYAGMAELAYAIDLGDVTAVESLLLKIGGN